MADASGAAGGTELLETFCRTKRVRGVIFRSPERREFAKLRQRAVRAICKFARLGAFIRVVWRHETSGKLSLWSGRVVDVCLARLKSESLSGLFRVRYEERPSRNAAVPPLFFH